MSMYDVIIVGSGPAGMTAALYALRSKLKVAIIENYLPGGQLNNTSEIENYSGIKSISGQGLAEQMQEQITDLDVEYIFDEVVNLEDLGSCKIVYGTENVYHARTVIIASGTSHKKLNVKGEDTFLSKGVSYCAICDGSFFSDKEVVVVGGGDSAVEEAIYLTGHAKKVYLVHRRDELRAQKYLQEKAFNNSKIEILWNTEVISINGEDSVSSVTLVNNETNLVFDKDIDGIFIYVGLAPNNSFLPEKIVSIDGFVVTNNLMQTSIKGVYAVGDIRDKKLRQVSTAVGDGAIAGQEVYEYILRNS